MLWWLQVACNAKARAALYNGNKMNNNRRRGQAGEGGAGVAGVHQPPYAERGEQRVATTGTTTEPQPTTGGKMEPNVTRKKQRMATEGERKATTNPGMYN